MDTSDFINHLLDGDDRSLEEYPYTPELDKAQHPYKKNVRQAIEVYLDRKRLKMELQDPINENIEEEDLCGY